MVKINYAINNKEFYH